MTITDEPTGRTSDQDRRGTEVPDGLPASLTDAVRRRLTSLVSASGDAPTVTTHAPFSGAPIVELPQSSPDDVVAAAARARVAQRAWAARSIDDRAQVLLRLHDLVLDARDDLMDLIQAENGKSRRDAYLEVADIAITCRYYARTAASVLAPSGRTGLIPGAHVGPGAASPQGRRDGHLSVELPA